jgi:hypothetical protein
VCGHIQAKKRAQKALRREDLFSPYGYTVASERAYFEHVKETLHSTGRGEAYGDLIRLLGMYASVSRRTGRGTEGEAGDERTAGLLSRRLDGHLPSFIQLCSGRGYSGTCQ